MIKFNITMTNKWFYSLITVSILFALGISVYAYQFNMRTGSPSIMGHSAGEINVENSAGEIVGLQEALSGDNDILSSCQICRRYADANGRASAQWVCADFGNELLTDFVGDVNSDDSFDLKIMCSNPNIQNSYKFCRRYADANGRASAQWVCADFGNELLTDFVGDVNSDDDFDLVIAPKNAGEIKTSCGICRRYADADGRASAPWVCATIQNPLLTDFVSNVNFDDDFDLKLSCNILFEEGSG